MMIFPFPLGLGLNSWRKMGFCKCSPRSFVGGGCVCLQLLWASWLALAQGRVGPPWNGDCISEADPDLWSHPHHICWGDSPDHIPLMHVSLF